QQFYVIKRNPTPGSEAERLFKERQAEKFAKKGLTPDGRTLEQARLDEEEAARIAEEERKARQRAQPKSKKRAKKTSAKPGGQQAQQGGDAAGSDAPGIELI